MTELQFQPELEQELTYHWYEKEHMDNGDYSMTKFHNGWKYTWFVQVKAFDQFHSTTEPTREKAHEFVDYISKRKPLFDYRNW